MRTKSAAIFLATCAVTAIGWVMFWPDKPVEPINAAAPEPVVEPWRRDELDALIATLENGKSDQEKLQAALRLEKIPASEVPSILASIQTTRDGNLTLPAKALLIRWASQDPEAAINWAWQEFRSQSAWNTAFREIGPAWAWRDPEGLKTWTLARLAANPPTKERPFGDLTAEEAKALDAPAFQFGDVGKISEWLLKEDPKFGMEIFLKRSGFSTSDSNLADSFTDPRKIERALLAFPSEMLEPLKTRDRTTSFTFGPEIYAQELLRRWRTLDPPGFQSSTYTIYLPKDPFKAAEITDEDWAKIEPAQREKAAQEKLASVSEKQSPSSAASIAERWVTTDPAACREWIETLSGDNAKTATGAYVEAQATTSLTETLDWIERGDTEQRGPYLVRAFDTWTKANPDAEPDFAGWSESRKQAWLDLAACASIGRP
jgi:hypothetical protein